MNELFTFLLSLSIFIIWTSFIFKFIKNGEVVYQSFVFRKDEDAFAFWAYIIFSIVVCFVILISGIYIWLG